MPGEERFKLEGGKTLAEKRNAVVLRGIKKYFPGTKALDWGDDDTIEIKEGEIHGLSLIHI